MVTQAQPGVRVGQRGEAERADDEAHQHEAEHRAELQPVEQRNDHPGGGQDDQRGLVEGGIEGSGIHRESLTEGGVKGPFLAGVVLVVRELSRDRKLVPGADAVCVVEGNMSKSANASTWATRRGRRTWHARTLHVREPDFLPMVKGKLGGAVTPPAYRFD